MALVALAAGLCLAWPATVRAQQRTGQGHQQTGRWLVYYKISSDPFAFNGDSDSVWKLSRRFHLKADAEKWAAKIRSGQQKPQGQRKIIEVVVRCFNGQGQPPRQPPKQQNCQPQKQKQKSQLQRQQRQRYARLLQQWAQFWQRLA
jgi:hypothetical protein